MKKILVTGSNGQVGKAFQFIHKNFTHDFYFVDRNKLDITDKFAIDKLFSQYSFDIIINCAAYTAVDQAEKDIDTCYKINRDGVKNLAEACASLHPKKPLFIHLSSDYVYHPQHENIMDEEEKTNPRSVYAKSKLAGEKKALETYKSTIIIRTSWVFATVGKNFVNTIKNLSANRSELNIVNDQYGSPTYAPDIATTIMELIQIYEQNPDSELAGIYNFCNAGLTNWFEFAKEIIKICNHTCEIHGIPSSEYPTPAERPLNSRMNTAKIQNILQHPIRNWKDALKECLN